MVSEVERPPVLRRVAAIVAMAIVVVLIVWAVIRIVDRPLVLLAIVALMIVFVMALWAAVTHARSVRALSLTISIAAVAGVIAILILGGPFDVIAAVILLGVAVALVRYAISRDTRTLKRADTPGTPVGAARHGVLIMNLRSGGGKAEKFNLVDECRRRDIEPVVLQPGDDLLDLARRAVDTGADVIGMAGGDGSQALVASIAAERDVPMVVVPAGTRNHLALDLGIDREDVVGALDAYGDAVERSMGLGEVNERVFVNNVSLGLYAEIVQSPEYRDAKLSTVLAALPKMLGPGTDPMDLRYDDHEGTHHDGAHLIQVSNGPYGRTMLTVGSRTSVDAGVLAVVAVALTGQAASSRFLGALGAGHPERYPGFQSWTATTFEVQSGAPVPVGLDGETLELEPPLRFTIRPHALRVRLPPRAIGESPAARALPWREAVPELWRVALGKPVGVPSDGPQPELTQPPA
jgi:diacylglycerol kinase family enzyme